jgi:hypothetical protein
MKIVCFVKLSIIAVTISISCAGLFAQSMPPRYVPEALGFTPTAAPLRVAERSSAPSLTLSSAEFARPEALEALREWNAAGREPEMIGIRRRLDSPLRLSRIVDPDTGQPVFAASLRLENTPSLRVHFTGSVRDALITVWGADGKAYAFNCSDECWSPTVFGDMAYLESDSDATVDEVIEAPTHGITSLARQEAVPSCFVDATCITASTLDVISDYRRAVAQLDFVTSDGAFVCTGALINNNFTSGTPQPYLLTANHCISTPAAASSLEAFWDYRSATCGVAPPSLSTLQRSDGASIVAMSSTTDFTLLRLNNLPSGRALLGYDGSTAAVPVGTTLYRISHPAISDGSGVYGQLFSSTVVNGTTSCGSSLFRPAFLFSSLVTGAVDGGSSGAPVIKSGGYIVGQLLGRCFPAGVTDPCSTLNQTVDGAFSGTYPVIASVLNPATSGCTACVANANTACLLGGRFKATLTWHDFSANQSGAGSIIKYSENLPEVNSTYGPLSEIAFFSMFPSAPKSVEAIVRMFKGVTINDKYWVFLSGFATAEYTVTVTDTQTCGTWTRTVPTGSTNTTKDFSAFPFP